MQPKEIEVEKVFLQRRRLQEWAALVQLITVESMGWFFLSHPSLSLLMKSDMRWTCHRYNNELQRHFYVKNPLSGHQLEI